MLRSVPARDSRDRSPLDESRYAASCAVAHESGDGGATGMPVGNRTSGAGPTVLKGLPEGSCVLALYGGGGSVKELVSLRPGP